MPVPGYSDLIVTSHSNETVHLWDIGDKGELAHEWECRYVHVRQVVQLEKWVTEIVASPTQLIHCGPKK
jgi:hypothetical protein